MRYACNNLFSSREHSVLGFHILIQFLSFVYLQRMIREGSWRLTAQRKFGERVTVLLLCFHNVIFPLCFISLIFLEPCIALLICYPILVYRPTIIMSIGVPEYIKNKEDVTVYFQ